ncbi:MAG: adenosylcobinamide-GDP ribazoletransferase [Chitinispirillaceae bacterium]|nr:adenosylcobinamide-GDP ribazoletransferase [Chitinispirillaceae bacterium]
MINALVTALRTLTIVPLPGRDTDDYSKSLLFFPLAGGVIALLLYPFFWICQQIPEIFHQIQGLVFTFIAIVITGGLHIDGIADVADGFIGGKDKEMILKIMKDSRIGTFGGVAIGFDLLFRFVIYGYVISNLNFLPVVCAIVNSRIAQAIVLTSCRYARGPEGTAAPFSGSRKNIPFLAGMTVVINALIYYFSPAVTVPLSLAITTVAVAGTVWYFIRRIGGITGDCIGCINEIAEIVLLLSWCIVSSYSG